MRIGKRKAAVLVGIAAAAGVLTAGAAIASSDDAEAPITGTDLEKAEKAALAETGGGRVTDTEVDDEESKYEVEVTLDDGTQVDVQLDEDFRAVGSESDGTADEEDDSE